MIFCPECGKPVAPKAKVSRNCGASQLDDAFRYRPHRCAGSSTAPSSAPAPVIPIQPQQAPVVSPSVISSLCSACGSPLLPSEKF
ncbi:MAG: hypothetical protein WCF90_08055 [Methanomicrobiales archaeon]